MAEAIIGMTSDTNTVLIATTKVVRRALSITEVETVLGFDKNLGCHESGSIMDVAPKITSSGIESAYPHLNLLRPIWLTKDSHCL